MCSWTGRIPLLLLLCFLALPARAVDYQSVQEGLDYAVLQPSPGSSKIHLLRVNLKKYRVKVLSARELNSPALSAKAMAEQSHALAAINANFFASGYQPLGLVLEDGKLLNPPKAIS